MFTRILVPLDGSQRGERALTVAARLAHASHGSILLAQVIGIPIDYGAYTYGPYQTQSPTLAQDVLEAEQTRAQNYLESIQQSEALAGIKTETKVMTGTAASSIEDIEDEEQIDLIIMCSRSDTGFKRWVLGSVSQKVARHSSVPVLILQEDGAMPDTPFPDRLRPQRSIVAMVALDGSSFSEVAIEPAAQLVAPLAAPAQGTLLLTTVVPAQAAEATEATEATDTSPDKQSTALDEAQRYLNGVAQRYAELAGQLNIALQTSIASGDKIADALIRAAEQGEGAEGKRLSGGCDLIAITTHGRTGLERLTMGSVTESVLGSTQLPLLILHNTAS